uniref:hypothetical protein n=1 Tax=uncultured Marinococcus sp. TaxID=487012 RepID=UPI00261F2B6F
GGYAIAQMPKGMVRGKPAPSIPFGHASLQTRGFVNSLSSLRSGTVDEDQTLGASLSFSERFDIEKQG